MTSKPLEQQVASQNNMRLSCTEAWGILECDQQPWDLSRAGRQFDEEVEEVEGWLLLPEDSEALVRPDFHGFFMISLWYNKDIWYNCGYNGDIAIWFWCVWCWGIYMCIYSAYMHIYIYIYIILYTVYPQNCIKLCRFIGTMIQYTSGFGDALSWTRVLGGLVPGGTEPPMKESLNHDIPRYYMVLCHKVDVTMVNLPMFLLEYIGIRALPCHVLFVSDVRQEFADVLRMSGEWLGRTKIMARLNMCILVKDRVFWIMNHVTLSAKAV